MISATTSVFGYLMADGKDGGRVGLYAQFISADPSAVMVPLAARPECLESAVHNVRTGLIQGICVDHSLSGRVSPLVDAVTKEASVAGVIDTVFADPKTGALVGDCAAVKAVSALTRNLDSVTDPLILIYGDGWETRVAMTALSGRVTMMEIAAHGNESLNSIPTGCVVEYAGDEEIVTYPYDLVVNPPPGFSPTSGQRSLPMTAGAIVPFESMRLAYSVGKFRNLPDQVCEEMAKSYAKKSQTV